MSAGWVAGSVRAQAMARRRLGTDAVRTLAASGSLAEALETLRRSPYGDRIGAGEETVASGGRAVAETLLWNLRVLAGWLPPDGAEVLRILAGWFEIANVDEHLRVLAGEPADPPFRLGTLSTAWPMLHAAGSSAELRTVLARTPWRDPGGETARDIQLAMRLAWAERVATRIEPARCWASGAVALLVARERIARDRTLPAASAAAADRMLGPGATAAASLADLAGMMPARASWVLDGVGEPVDLWRAEHRWWRRVGSDGMTLVAGSSFGPARIVGATALLATDARLVQGALAVAAHGAAGGEVFDALA